MARSSSSAKLSHPGPLGTRPAESDVPEVVLGGPVGQMLRDLDARMALQPARMPYADIPEDIFHTISVGVGYVGLVTAFAGSGALIWWLAHHIA